MNVKKISVIGAGLYGCLTAWKIKKKYPSHIVELIKSSDHLISAFDPIKIGKKFYNNGFHGIELPRSQELSNFLTSALNIKLKEKKNIKKILINGEIIDYLSSYSNYPDKVKSHYKKIPSGYLKNYKEAYEYISDDFRELLKKISQRYSSEISDVEHLLIPWFFPTEFDLLSIDEGAKFRTNVRAGRIKAKYAWPESMLFSDIQKPFIDSLQSLGVKMYFNSKVFFNKAGVTILKESTDKIEKLDLKSDDIVFYCLSPIALLKNLSQELLNNLLKTSRLLIICVVRVKSSKEAKNFVEMLCANKNFFELSRISKTNYKNKIQNEENLQLEIFLEENWNKDLLKKKIRKFFDEVMRKHGYNLIEIIDLKETRKVFFPSKEDLVEAVRSINSWSKKFPTFKVLDAFGPINMSKTWIYSEDNINFVNKIIKKK